MHSLEIDFWITTIATENTLWSVVHHTLAEVETFMSTCSAFPDQVKRFRAAPEFSMHWSGFYDDHGMAMRCCTAPKKLVVQIGIPDC